MGTHTQARISPVCSHYQPNAMSLGMQGILRKLWYGV